MTSDWVQGIYEKLIKYDGKKTLVETVLENRKRPVAEDFRPVARPVCDEHGNIDAFEAFMRGATRRQVEEHGRTHLQKDKP